MAASRQSDVDMFGYWEAHRKSGSHSTYWWRDMLRALRPPQGQYFARPAQGLPFGEREGLLCERARTRVRRERARLWRHGP
jgi:hypothetical protein